jgi:hypothetical protein
VINKKGNRICEKCGEIHKMTKHHVFPKRFFTGAALEKIVWLCRYCHDIIEKLIPRWKKLTEFEYVAITATFLGEPVEEMATVFL